MIIFCLTLKYISESKQIYLNIWQLNSSSSPVFKLNYNIVNFWFMLKLPLTQELRRLKDSKTIRNKISGKYSA